MFLVVLAMTTVSKVTLSWTPLVQYFSLTSLFANHRSLGWTPIDLVHAMGFGRSLQV